MPRIIQNGEPQIIAQAKIGALMTFPVLVETKNGQVAKTFERFVRPPGTRIIAVRDKKIFLQNEARLELKNKLDWRLPGGKVFDNFKDYQNYIGKLMPEEIILEAGKKELQEEAGLSTTNISIFKKSSCGALVEWDLYYLVAKDTTSFESEYDEGEEIIDGKWFTFEETLSMCKNGEISEDRTVSALYQFISKN